MSSPFEQLPEDRFGDLLRRLEPRLKRELARFRIPPEDAEDVLQESFFHLYIQWDHIRDREAWLMGTLKRQCLLYWRKRKRCRTQAVEPVLLEFLSPPVEADQERAQLMRDLQELIDSLPERCRSLLTLRFRMGFEPPEVAETMSYSPTSIGKITSRCLDLLIRQLVIEGPSGRRGAAVAADAAEPPRQPPKDSATDPKPSADPSDPPPAPARRRPRR